MNFTLAHNMCLCAQKWEDIPYSTKTFEGENFHGLLTFAVTKDVTPQNFTEKTFTNNHKTVKFTKVFSLERFTLYGISYKFYIVCGQHCIHYQSQL